MPARWDPAEEQLTLRYVRVDQFALAIEDKYLALTASQILFSFGDRLFFGSFRNATPVWSDNAPAATIRHNEPAALIEGGHVFPNLFGRFGWLG